MCPSDLAPLQRAFVAQLGPIAATVVLPMPQLGASDQVKVSAPPAPVPAPVPASAPAPAACPTGTGAPAGPDKPPASARRRGCPICGIRHHHVCFVCSTRTRDVCSTCRSVFYCNAECQRRDWPVHQEECRRLESDRAYRKARERADQGVPLRMLCRVCPGDGVLCCKGCRSSFYCSQSCQRADWSAHKKECAGLALKRDEEDEGK